MYIFPHQIFSSVPALPIDIGSDLQEFFLLFFRNKLNDKEEFYQGRRKGHRKEPSDRLSTTKPVLKAKNKGKFLLCGLLICGRTYYLKG
jgi:hypothetical protein